MLALISQRRFQLYPMVTPHTNKHDVFHTTEVSRYTRLLALLLYKLIFFLTFHDSLKTVTQSLLTKTKEEMTFSEQLVKNAALNAQQCDLDVKLFTLH